VPDVWDVIHIIDGSCDVKCFFGLLIHRTILL
jgi:hypothetical protein